jgi:hypothetical protein
MGALRQGARYLSIVDAHVAEWIAFVAWGNTSMNPLAFGSAEIGDALRRTADAAVLRRADKRPVALNAAMVRRPPVI